AAARYCSTTAGRPNGCPAPGAIRISRCTALPTPAPSSWNTGLPRPRRWRSPGTPEVTPRSFRHMEVSCMSTLQPYLDGAFSRLHLLVIGEAMLDTYLKGTTERLCREAPVPVVTLQDQEYVPGGAANAAVNMRALGAE